MSDFFEGFEDLDLNIHGVRLPEIIISPEDYKTHKVKVGSSNYDFLRQLCLDGFSKLNLKKGTPEYKEYVDRAKRELSILNELNFTDYILLVWDVINFCKKKDIPTGFGRGSAAGSLVLYLIGVTRVDPIKYGLYFERFVSKARAKSKVVDGILYLDGSLTPDVDLDLCYYRRSEAIEYIEDKYKGKTSKIITFNTLSSKLLLKEVGKIAGEKSESEMTEITKLIPKDAGIVADLDEAYKGVPELRKWCDENSFVYNICLKLKDLIKNKGVHPAGQLISYYPLQEMCPIEMSSDKSLVASYDMGSVSMFSVKLDLLGLRGVSVVDDACKAVGIDIMDIDLNDPIIYQNLQQLDSQHGLFQIEANLAHKVVNKVKPKNLNELSAVLALSRPGALQFIDQYANYTCHGIYEPIHVFFDDILKPTGAVCLYQEQLLKMVNKIGFSLEESEEVRRCVTGDTLFLSKTRGWISINSLIKSGYKEDLFLVMDENGKQCWKQVKDIWSNGIQQTRYVEARNGMEIRTSRWHQFLTDDGWKARNYLSQDDHLVCAKEVEWDGVDVISKDMAIVISGLITEGYFVYGPSATFVNYDEEVMSQFTRAFYNIFGENSLRLNNPQIACIRKKEKEEIARYLHQGKSASKFFPECMMGMTKQTTADFLSFVFACEGTVIETELSITSASKKLILQIQLLLLRFGIRSSIYTKPNKIYKKDYYTLDIGQQKDIIKFNKHLSHNLQNYKKEKLLRQIKPESVVFATTDVIPAKLWMKFKHQYGYLFCHDSGRMYKSNMSREKATRYAHRSNDKIWINKCEGKQEYIKFESQERDTREVEVFDFTVDDETPYIIANGFVIHNCVGKKKIEEMKTWEDKINAKIKEKGLDPKIGEILWGIAEASAKYSFNLSHSLAYSALTAITVYLKNKYPQQFFLSLLKMSLHEPETTLEVYKIQKEMPRFGINLLPPNILLSKDNFSKEGKDIRYGFLAIKGISEKSMEKLNGFRQEYSNKFELFEAANKSEIHMGVLCPLIQAGCLEGYDVNNKNAEKTSSLGGKKESRSYTVYQAQLWNVLTDKEKKIALEIGQEFDYSIVAVLKKMLTMKTPNGKEVLKASRHETIKAKSENFTKIFATNRKYEKIANWWYENILLGYSYSSNLSDLFSNADLHCAPLKQVVKQKETTMHFAGVVSDKVRTKKSRKGKNYLELILKDEGESVRVMFFEPRFNATTKIPKENDIVMVKGLVKEDGVVFADEIYIQSAKIYTKLSDLKRGEKD